MFPHTFLPQSLFNLTEWAQVCIQTTEQAWSFRLWQFLHSNLGTYDDFFWNLATFTIVKKIILFKVFILLMIDWKFYWAFHEMRIIIFNATSEILWPQKIVSRRLPITALPPSWYKIKFQPKPPKKYWPKMGVGRVLKLVIFVSMCIIAMFICTFENIVFGIGRLTNIDWFFLPFSI